MTYQDYTSHGSADFLTAVDPSGPAAATYPNLLTLLAQQQALGARTHLPIDTNLNGTGGSLLAVENLTKVDLNDQLTVRNIFGFDRAVFNYRANLFGTELPIFNVISDHYPANQLTDELQMLGKSFAGRLDWVVGAFYSDQGPPDRSVFPTLDIQVLMPAGTPQDVANVNIQRRLLLSSKAVFVQGTYDLGDVIAGLKLTAGVRETWDHRLDSSLSSGVVTSLASDSSAPTWTAALEYQVQPDTSVYFTSRRGYRAGGSTSVGAVPIRTNADVYYQDYSNIQVNQLIPYPGQPGGVNITSNAAAARLWGAEFEAQAILTQNFQVGVNFAHLSFAYTKFGVGVDSAGLIAGETANRIPWEYGLNARYNLPIAAQLGQVSMQANWHWQAQFGDFLGTGVIPAYGLLNLSANWNQIGNAPVDAQLFVANALNKTYQSGGIGFLGVTERTFGDPRLYGMRLTYRF